MECVHTSEAGLAYPWPDADICLLLLLCHFRMELLIFLLVSGREIPIIPFIVGTKLENGREAVDFLKLKRLPVISILDEIYCQ